MQKDPLEHRLLSYRNGYYQGQVKNGHRHGYGILIHDDGAIIVTLWKNDMAFGKGFVFVNSQQFGFVEFNRGEPEGCCYFRSERQMLVSRFKNGKPIDRQLLANLQEHTGKILVAKNSSYQTVQEFQMQQTNEQIIALKYLDARVQLPTIAEYLQGQFCKVHNNFEVVFQSNGNAFFRYAQKGNPHSVGFVVNKRNQLMSYGIYLNQKLQGIGCKFDASGRYQGQFEGGQLNGLGMILSNGRYSFGYFEKGNIIQAFNLEEKSKESEQKLKQLKKNDHIRSNFFYNDYLPKKIMKFKGISQITSLSSYLKEIFYEHSKPPTLPHTSSSLKGSNVSLNQVLGSTVPSRENQLVSKTRPHFGRQIDTKKTMAVRGSVIRAQQLFQEMSK